MVLRREDDIGRSVENAADAKALAAELRDRAARMRNLPGMLDGGLEEVRSAIERVLRDYEKLSRRRFGPFQRDLEAIAKRTKELEDAGHLSPRHARVVAQALQHARRTHFWNARRALGKLEKALGPARAWQSDLEAYRTFHRKASQRVRDAEDALARLRGVPKPGASSEDVAALRAAVEACNRAADDAWIALTHRPLGEALEDLVAHPDVEGLGLLAVLEFAALRELSDLIESDAGVEGAIGERPLAELVATSEYTAAKWDRVFPQAIHVRRRLQELFHQVRPVVGGKYGTAFTADAPVPILERRLGAWRRFPGAGDRPAWAVLVELRASGRIPAIQESAKVYERFGDLAEKAWDGSLAVEVEEQVKELAAAKKGVAGLPSPDALGE